LIIAGSILGGLPSFPVCSVLSIYPRVLAPGFQVRADRPGFTFGDSQKKFGFSQIDDGFWVIVKILFNGWVPFAFCISKENERLSFLFPVYFAFEFMAGNER
jgi:hypothetical protein